MKIKKNCFSTMISDLYGRDNYQPYITLGREYWWCWPDNSDVYRKTHKYWHKLKITYIRSGCMFYVLDDAPELGELFCPIDCIMASRFVLAELDPVKDLKGLLDNIDTEAAKLEYCFDDEHTIIKNWPNEREVEIDEDELYTKFGDSIAFVMIKMLETKEK